MFNYILLNLPLWLFFASTFVVLILFLWAGIALLIAKKDPEKSERGKKILSVAISGLFAVLFVTFIFNGTIYFLEKQEALRRIPETGEFPASLAVNFPPAPKFIKIEKYYFTGPFELKDNEIIKERVAYSVLCKEGQEYAIIYINRGEKNQNLLIQEKYECWKEECGKDIYVAFFSLPEEKYNSIQIRDLFDELIQNTEPFCNQQ